MDSFYKPFSAVTGKVSQLTLRKLKKVEKWFKLLKKIRVTRTEEEILNRGRSLHGQYKQEN